MERKQMPEVSAENARIAHSMLDAHRASDALSDALDKALDSPEHVYCTRTAKTEDGKPGIVWEDEEGNEWMHVL